MSPCRIVASSSYDTASYLGYLYQVKKIYSFLAFIKIYYEIKKFNLSNVEDKFPNHRLYVFYIYIYMYIYRYMFV